MELGPGTLGSGEEKTRQMNPGDTAKSWNMQSFRILGIVSMMGTVIVVNSLAHVRMLGKSGYVP